MIYVIICICYMLLVSSAVFSHQYFGVKLSYVIVVTFKYLKLGDVAIPHNILVFACVYLIKAM